MGRLLDVLCVCVLCFAFDCSFFVFVFFGLYVCLFAFFSGAPGKKNTCSVEQANSVFSVNLCFKTRIVAFVFSLLIFTLR